MLQDLKLSVIADNGVEEDGVMVVLMFDYIVYCFEEDVEECGV